MGYAIICDARKGGRLGISVLGLVDRAKTKKTWWTSDSPHLLIRYRKKEAAIFAARRLKKNDARVVPYTYAVSVISAQNKNILHEEAIASLECGWDSHKDAF